MKRIGSASDFVFLIVYLFIFSPVLFQSRKDRKRAKEERAKNTTLTDLVFGEKKKGFPWD